MLESGLFNKKVATNVELNMPYTKMFIYVCSMWNWLAILQSGGMNLAIQDGCRFLPIKAWVELYFQI